MVRGLPSRPLHEGELDALTESDAIRLALPATPNSIRDDEEGRRRIYDLLLFLEEAVATVAYDEAEKGWTIIANEKSETAYEDAFDALVEYRGYSVEREDAVREIIKEMYGISSELYDLDVDELE